MNWEKYYILINYCFIYLNFNLYVLQVKFNAKFNANRQINIASENKMEIRFMLQHVYLVRKPKK